MRLVPIVIALAALAGCSSESQQAEREYQLVRKNSTGMTERCMAAGRVKDAYRRAGDAQNYKKWGSTETFDCFMASQGA